MIIKDYIDQLEAEFAMQANKKIAVGQMAYMKNKFEFYGIPAPLRREIQKPFLIKKYLPPKKDLDKIIRKLWNKPQREFQMFGMELVSKYEKVLEEHDMKILEYMVTHKSWWDTVDFIAAHSMGAYFTFHPTHRREYVKQWLESNNIWLQRSALLFQLNYKDKLDTDLLAFAIKALLGSNEFFINKAIGWVLRQYSRSNPKWVINFCRETQLLNLSRREALRLIQ